MWKESMQKGKIGGDVHLPLAHLFIKPLGTWHSLCASYGPGSKWPWKESSLPEACSNVAMTEQDGKSSPPLTVMWEHRVFLFLFIHKYIRNKVYECICVCVCVCMNVHTHASLLAFIQVVLKFNSVVPCCVHGKAYWSTECFASIWVVLNIM